MSRLAALVRDLVWLAAAAALAWFSWRTFLAVQGVSLVITLLLRQAERMR